MRNPAVSDYGIYGIPYRSGQDGDLVHVEMLRTREAIHDGIIRPHRHSDRDQLLLWHAGDAVLHFADRTIPVSAPTLILIPMGAVHGIAAAPRSDAWVASPTREFLLAAAGPELSRHVRALDQPVILKLSATDYANLSWMFAEMLREFGARQAFHLAISSGILRMVLAFLHRNLPAMVKAEHIEVGGDRLISRLRVLIEAHYRTHRNIADYARDLAVSERHLVRTCERFGDRSPGQMVLERRLMEAKRLLRFSSLPLLQVAYDLGFHDSAHFSRFFKAKVGMPPIAWRQQQPSPSV